MTTQEALDGLKNDLLTFDIETTVLSDGSVTISIADVFDNKEEAEKFLEYLKSSYEKAAKWDDLHHEISKFYCDKTGEYNSEYPERKGDVCDIGVVAATAFNWL